MTKGLFQIQIRSNSDYTVIFIIIPELAVSDFSGYKVHRPFLIGFLSSSNSVYVNLHVCLQEFARFH